MQKDDAILRINGLCAEIAPNIILRGDRLDLEKGQIISLIGPNGSGKTSLLRCIIGFLRIKSGDIIVKGRPLKSYSPKELGKIIAYIPQNHPIDMPFTVDQYLMTGRYPHFAFFGGPGPQDHKTVGKIKDKLNLSSFGPRQISSLSGGERQRIIVASALVQEPSILLLDELTTFLDPTYQSEILSIIVKMAKEDGLSIISATHDLNSAAQISDQIVALKERKIIWQLPKEKAFCQEKIQQALGQGIELVKTEKGPPLAMIKIENHRRLFDKRGANAQVSSQSIDKRDENINASSQLIDKRDENINASSQSINERGNGICDFPC